MREITISINGGVRTVKSGTTVAAAVLNEGTGAFRTSVTGEPRAALCGMGSCYECRLMVDGVSHVRSCQILCRPGMNIVTG